MEERHHDYLMFDLEHILEGALDKDERNKRRKHLLSEPRPQRRITIQGEGRHLVI